MNKKFFITARKWCHDHTGKIISVAIAIVFIITTLIVFDFESNETIVAPPARQPRTVFIEQPAKTTTMEVTTTVTEPVETETATPTTTQPSIVPSITIPSPPPSEPEEPAFPPARPTHTPTNR